MLIGVSKEIKADEYRVGLVPETIKELVTRGHEVCVETMAGDGAGIGDGEYAAAGAQIANSADQIFRQAELIVKVKELLASERAKLQHGQMIFTYLHLAPDPEQTKERPHGGRGILLGGIEGAPSAKIVILGGGVVGSNAAAVATGMGADVTVIARSAETLRYLFAAFWRERSCDETGLRHHRCFD